MSAADADGPDGSGRDDPPDVDRAQVSPAWTAAGSAVHCERCGHAWTLHGNRFFAAWCIGFSDNRFCGCSVTNLSAAA